MMRLIRLFLLFYFVGLNLAAVEFYAEAFTRFERGYGLSRQGNDLVLPDGSKIPFESSRVLPGHPWAAADLKTVLRFPYPKSDPGDSLRARDHDPGRYRNYQLLKAVYGSTREEVRRSLVTLRFCGFPLEFSSKNGAAAALKRVSDEIEARPRLLAWIRDLRARDQAALGTWCWRVIAGTEMLSPHSFGIAIDILDRASSKIPYWRYVHSDPSQAEAWPELIGPDRIWQPPADLVECFERHGFIWGGRWYHFDTMHFEFRPEFFDL